MCNFWSCIITKDMKVLWDRDITSHEELVKKYSLKDDKLENREFVRLEIKPTDIRSKRKSDWMFKVDEEGTMPSWYSGARRHCEALVWRTWQEAMKQTLWKLPLEVADANVKEIKGIKYLKMNGKLRANWHVSFGAILPEARAAAGDAARAAAGAAAGDAAWDAARDAARAAARDAARAAAGDAARDAARAAAWDAAGAAAGDAAWDAAGDAAGAAAGDAAWAAAWDAAIYTRVKFCVALKAKLDTKHIKHAEERMDVWRRGFGLYCDVNGKLYVYAVGKKEDYEVE